MTTPGSPDPPAGSEDTREASAPSDHQERIGPYRLLQRVGEGGMGEVWLAEQAAPVRRQVALKVIKSGMDTAQVIARFEAERQALALMDHPAIAVVFDAGTTAAGRPYFAMEYVTGEPITAYCDRHRLSTRNRLELFIQVCEGVQHAHQKGVIHRDLKPSNVLVAVQDDHPVPKIIDFGVAKATTLRLTDRTLYTEMGVLLGTPEYMSPEQAEMTGLNVDTRTDVYALGVLLYELLTGALPFDRQTLFAKGLDEIRRTIREVEPPRPSARVTGMGPATSQVATNRHTQPGALARQLRGDLDWITMKTLDKDRTRRYQSSTELAADVRRFLEHDPVTAGPPGAAYRIRKFVRRHRFGAAVSGLLIGLTVAFGAVMSVQARRIANERDRANREALASKQVSDFLVGLFAVSDPSEARGRTLTAREILADGARRLEESLRTQPEVRARLQTTIGGVYTNLAMYQEAEPLLQRALETRRQLLGRDDADTLTTTNLLANVYWYQRNLAAAEPLYVEVSERRRQVLGPEHPDTLRADFDRASLFALRQRWTEAESLTRRTLDAQRRVLGADHPDTVASLGHLQYIYYGQGRFAEAGTIAARVLEHDRRTLGADHPDALVSAHNLATIYQKVGRHSEAEKLLQDVVADMRRVLGEDHPRTCRSLLALAGLYLEQKRFTDAEGPALAAYRGYARTMGHEHELTKAAASELEGIYRASGKSEKLARWREERQRAGPRD
jgi:non-specific serine/threonine protein kinase/serine/threonine-protein kinase